MHGSHVKLKQWQAHRKISLGPVRRACPASGASWNVQVVRGKMTSKCLWHACQALALGFLLMVIGAGMATIGFIIVAACVMTFEARDSASKVVPARFKLNYGKHEGRSRSAERRPTGLSVSTTSQTNRWDSDSKNSSLEINPNDINDEQQSQQKQQMAVVHACKTLGKNDEIRLLPSKIKGSTFRCHSASDAADHEHSTENKITQTSIIDAKLCNVNERNQSKLATSKRPSSLKLPEHSKIRSKRLYRSRTKPEEPTKLTDLHVDGNVDDIFVISDPEAKNIDD